LQLLSKALIPTTPYFSFVFPPHLVDPREFHHKSIFEHDTSLISFPYHFTTASSRPNCFYDLLSRFHILEGPALRALPYQTGEREREVMSGLASTMRTHTTPTAHLPHLPPTLTPIPPHKRLLMIQNSKV